MNPRIRFTPEASAELEEAAAWYESQRAGLGFALLAAVDRAIEAMARWPNAGTPIEPSLAGRPVRRVPVGRFPYYVAYVVTTEAIHVLAFAHERRRPVYWSGRIARDAVDE